MNIDTVAGECTVAKGRFKESLGTATRDPLLQRDGIADQVSGTMRQAFGGLRDFVNKPARRGRPYGDRRRSAFPPQRTRVIAAPDAE